MTGVNPLYNDRIPSVAIFLRVETNNDSFDKDVCRKALNVSRGNVVIQVTVIAPKLEITVEISFSGNVFLMFPYVPRKMVSQI